MENYKKELDEIYEIINFPKKLNKNILINLENKNINLKKEINNNDLILENIGSFNNQIKLFNKYEELNKIKKNNNKKRNKIEQKIKNLLESK
jgi:hypothetical protein